VSPGGDTEIGDAENTHGNAENGGVTSGDTESGDTDLPAHVPGDTSPKGRPVRVAPDRSNETLGEAWDVSRREDVSRELLVGCRPTGRR
jgi:hypothetical protein